MKKKIQIAFNLVLILLLTAASSFVSTPKAKAAALCTAGSGGTVKDLFIGDAQYKVHTFTVSGTFVAPSNNNCSGSLQVLVVGGGGGGGNAIDRTGGGGGGGGVIYNSSFSVNPKKSFAVTVGIGVSGNTNGNNSSFSTLTAIGGGRGGQAGSGATTGGSGGGGFHNAADSGKAGTAGQGNSGGNGYDSGVIGQPFAGGGGGGGGQNGSNGTSSAGGLGGNGFASSINGSSLYYGGGGGGGGENVPGGSGGLGGGGKGGQNGSGTAGTNNTGGGGGGGGSGGVGGAGASGIVIIRYLIVPPTPPSCTGATPDNDWTTANSGTRTVTLNGVSNATSGRVVVWTDINGQDDIFSYPTTTSGTTWTADINLANHPGLGFVWVYAYLTNPNFTDQVCDGAGANFTRLNTGTINVTSDSSSSWTINNNLTNPTYPAIPPGTSSTTGSYTNKPYATWTITPTNIPGYDWTVNSCAINTPCSAVFP